MIELIVSNTHRLARRKNLSKKFYLGDWCFDDLHSLRKINKDQLIQNDWNDYNVRQKDYKRIKKKINIYIKILSKYLNNLHKTKYSLKYWRVLLYVWLGYYLPYQYIRFKLIKKTIENNNLFINIHYSSLQNLTLDTIGFYNKSSSCEEYNYKSFLRIILFLKSKGYKIKIFKNKKKLKLEKKNNLDNNLKLKNSKYPIINIFDRLLHFITKKNPVLLMGGFRIKDFILLNLKLKQIPLGGYQIFNWYEIRGKFKLLTKEKNLVLKNKNRNNLFDDYIDENIIQDLPQIYTTYFKSVNMLTKKIQLTPKVIFSSFKHYHDEIFKFWVANKIEKKINFFSICHGGHHQTISPVFDYDYLISKKYIQWFNQYKNKKLKLPIPFFINFKKKNKKRVNIYCIWDMNLINFLLV